MSDPATSLGWLSLLPPVVAIAAALLFRQVLVALATGIWLGATLGAGFDPVRGLLRTLDRYVVGAVADADHASILVFTVLLGGMVGVVGRSGGGTGLAALATRIASTRSRGQVSTWLLGLLVFFDDYANSLLIGTSMRPITDRLRISREKLAFLVDATAAPVASIAVVSSWIGVELSYIADQYAALGLTADPFVILLKTLPYRFYPILMLVFVLAVAWTGRDFGSMARAERRAQVSGQVLRPGSRPASDLGEAAEEATPRWANAVVPIGVLVLVALAGMFATGWRAAVEAGLEPTLRAVFGHASSLRALLWGAGGGCVAAVLMASFGPGRLGFTASMEAAVEGMRSMVVACLILVAAWALGAVCRDVGTAPFLVSLLGEGLPPGLLPALVFLTAAAVSFATGTSWGTMAILFPLVVPLAHALGGGAEHLMVGAIGSILAGAVFGDHCSPISDTTVLSSLAASCDHVDHVRTQLPYALSVGAVAVVVGELAVGFRWYPPWVGLGLGAALLLGLLRWRGRRPDP
ncbi:MAG: Na+/H+ antiporter NhaC family protein [Myxococcota bacterium]